jgi:regulator of protease activity HflC (stomatin/prohibitin superfamily)
MSNNPPTVRIRLQRRHTAQLAARAQVIPSKIVNSYYKLTSQTAQIRAYVFDVVRSTVPKLNLDDVFTSKDDIAMDVKEQLSASMETFGLSIIQTLLTDISPAAKVKAAMNEINAAHRLRAATEQKAEADKIRVVKAAEADAEAKYLAGLGIARQRQAIVNGLSESVKVVHPVHAALLSPTHTSAASFSLNAVLGIRTQDHEHNCNEHQAPWEHHIWTLFFPSSTVHVCTG